MTQMKSTTGFGSLRDTPGSDRRLRATSTVIFAEFFCTAFYTNARLVFKVFKPHQLRMSGFRV
jgi:hypothetical protein